MNLLRPLIAAAVMMTASVPAHAYSECTGRVVRMFTDSLVYVWFDTGLIWQKSAWFGTTPVELQSQATVKNILAVATTAMTTDRSMTVRFVADGVSCSGDKTTLEVWGVYLNAG